MEQYQFTKNLWMHYEWRVCILQVLHTKVIRPTTSLSSRERIWNKAFNVEYTRNE